MDFFAHPCAKFEQISTVCVSAEIFRRKQKSVTSLPILSKVFRASLYGQNTVFLLNCFIDTDELLTLSTASLSQKKKSDCRRYPEKESPA